MSKLLLDSNPLVVLPELACMIGLNEAIVLQQVHYWVVKNTEAKRNFRDGFFWVFNSYSDWQKQFPWWSDRTVKRIFIKLEDSGLLVSGNYNKLRMDRTKWYRINYEKLDERVPLCQIGTIEKPILSQPIPEINKETDYSKVKKVPFDGFANQELATEFEEMNGPKAERGNSIFAQTTQKFGAERVAYMLSVVDWYIDRGYPAYTGKEHPMENKAKRVVFADKLLACSDATVCDDQIIATTLQQALRNFENCDPTIYYITNPKVLGYWMIQDEEVGYECVNNTEYAPVETMY